MPVARKTRIWISLILLLGNLTLASQSLKPGISLNKWPLDTLSLPEIFSLNPATTPQQSLNLAPLQVFLPNQTPTAFFCRMELKAEKAIKFPFLFRLGSVDYVEKMEGKRNDLFIK